MYFVYPHVSYKTVGFELNPTNTRAQEVYELLGTLVYITHICAAFRARAHKTQIYRPSVKAEIKLRMLNMFT